MLRSTAGSRLFIGSAGLPYTGGAPVGLAAFGSVSWVEIGRMEGLGSLGVQWGTVPVGRMGDDGFDRVVKGRRSGAVMQISMGLDDGDAGQLKLVEAAGGHQDFPFRLVFEDVPTDPIRMPTRIWAAAVTGLTEAYDTAGSVMKRLADLATNSPVWSGAGRTP